MNRSHFPNNSIEANTSMKKIDPRARLTSLLLVEERLQEAEYFARHLSSPADSGAVGYELNAFLSAARSVTFVLQKVFSAVPGFEDWLNAERAELGKDRAARFFRDLRNYSQKEGRISLVGSRKADGTWFHMFAGNAEAVPPSLLHRPIDDCCLEHLAKLAQLVLRCAGRFPYHCSPERALTPEGISALGLDLDRLELAVGIPAHVSAARPVNTVEVRTRLLRRYVDEVDFDEIRRIANHKSLPTLKRNGDFGLSLGLSMVEQIEECRVTGEDAALAVKIDVVAEALGLKPEKG